jgi:LysM repeat protein
MSDIRAQPSSPTRRDPDEKPATYTVQQGDALSKIAERFGIKTKALIEANPWLRSNPDLIKPGQKLNLPPGQERGESRAVSEKVLVEPGDSLVKIAKRHGLTDWRRLIGGNPQLADSNKLQPGMVLNLPGTTTESPGRTIAAAAQSRVSIPPTSTDRHSGAIRYAPFSDEAIDLFRQAAENAGLPSQWAESAGLHNILKSESNGWVGVPNYTYRTRSRKRHQWGSVHRELMSGHKTTRSSATGLGQLLLANVEAYYPDGRRGIGEPLNEATGMLKYIKARYGTPEEAWRKYNTAHEGY